MSSQAVNSRHVQYRQEGLSRFIKEHDVCPVIYGDAAAMDYGA